jgi:hypothetical protein
VRAQLRNFRSHMNSSVEIVKTWLGFPYIYQFFQICRVLPLHLRVEGGLLSRAHAALPRPATLHDRPPSPHGPKLCMRAGANGLAPLARTGGAGEIQGGCSELHGPSARSNGAARSRLRRLRRVTAARRAGASGAHMYTRAQPRNAAGLGVGHGGCY